ncbi:NAD(P)-dependent oxidoreductase [Leptospira perolatii]|nr:NAD(P)-dependent oxidoreductase [Leptospira perolatii]
MLDRKLSLHLLFPDSEYEPIEERLRSHFELKGIDISISKGTEIGTRSDCLFIAPHEFSWEFQLKCIQKKEWNWIHLSTAGYDFFPLQSVSPRTLVTRSWKAYAQPLSEYILRAALNHAGNITKTGLRGQKIGVVGYGEVGRLTVHLLLQLGAQVRVLRKSGAEIPGIRVVRKVQDLLDVEQLILAIPLNSESVGIIDKNFLISCHEKLHIINVARGELIDQDALVEAVQNRGLNATLDVTVPEPLPHDHPLRNLKGVVVTNHIAWKSGLDIFYPLQDFLEVWDTMRAGNIPPGILKKREAILVEA